MDRFLRRHKIIKTCHSLDSLSPSPNSLSSSSDASPVKPRSPLLSKIKEHNPLSKSSSHNPSTSALKKIARNVKGRSVLIADGEDPGGTQNEDSNKGGVTKRMNKVNKMKRLIIQSVYQNKEEDEPSSQPPKTRGPVYGMPLKVAVERSQISDNLPLPRVFQETIMFLETFALQKQGIYRVPGYKAKMNELKMLYDRGEIIKLTNYDPETVTGALKLYLRELPEPLLTRQLGAKFEAGLQIENDDMRLHYLLDMMMKLPKEHYATLSWLCLHINHVCKFSDINKMTINNLIIVLSPTLLISNILLRNLIEHAEILFPGVKLDPNEGIPPIVLAQPPPQRVENEEINIKFIRSELEQSYVWARSRNEALEDMGDELRTRLHKEKNEVTGLEEKLRELEDNSYILSDSVTLRGGNKRKGSQDQQTIEDLKLYLGTLENENEQFENEKLELYNIIISETLACIEAYTEIRLNDVFNTDTAAEG